MIVDDKSSNKAELEKRFQFELTIYKDPTTHVESLSIVNFKDGQENGSIVTSVIELNKDIRTFKRFGVVIGDTYYRDLAQRIEAEYANIPVENIGSLSKDARYKDLISEIIDYFVDYKNYIIDDHCYMPVNMFNELASDCGYNEYEMRSLRGQLIDDDYVYMKQAGRFTMLKRLPGGKGPERVVAFDKNKLEIQASDTDDTKQSGDSDG